MSYYTILSLFLGAGFLWSNPGLENNKNVYNTESGKVAISFDLNIGKMSGNTAEAYSMIDLTAEAVVFNIGNTSFSFDSRIVEHHVKKVYLEVEKYPKTSFVGKLKGNIDYNSSEVQNIEVEGVLDMHGKGVWRTIPAQLRITEDKISVISNFVVKPEEHDMEIPKHLFTDGKDEILVKLEVEYAKFGNQ